MVGNKQIYVEHGKVYLPDKCEPLIDAWQAGKVQLEAWARASYPGKKLKPGVLPSISTIGYWNAQYQQEWGLDWHRNEGIEVTFLETGSMPFALEETEHMLTPGELTITRPWQLHKVGNPMVGVGKLYWFIIDVGVRHPHQAWNWPSWIMLCKNDLEELTKMLRQNEQPAWKVNAEIKRCFQKIGQLISGDQSASKESWVMLYVNEILMHLLEMFRNRPCQLDETLTDGSRTVELFIKNLKNNYFEPWTLESMAAHCGLGPTRFAHYFKQFTNRTPMQYLTLVRLEMAARFLTENPNLNVNTICYDCGFSSSQYFSTVFQKQFKCSPSAYRLAFAGRPA